MRGLRAIRGELKAGHLSISKDTRQDVVKFMSNPTGEAAKRFHFPRLTQLRFKLEAFFYRKSPLNLNPSVSHFGGDARDEYADCGMLTEIERHRSIIHDGEVPQQLIRLIKQRDAAITLCLHAHQIVISREQMLNMIWIKHHFARRGLFARATGHGILNVVKQCTVVAKG